MQVPIKYRNGIPLFYEKSSEEYRLDPYERFDPMVIRQSMIHLCDQLWENYSFGSVLRFVDDHISVSRDMNILEIGCGVGRMIADFANRFPTANCWGIDYSYQMLKRAKEVWIDGKSIEVDLSRFGFDKDIIVSGLSLTNLSFGLVKCESLPFEDGSQDVVFSSFLFDRLDDPLHGLIEMIRVLKSEGILLLVTPFNFTKSNNWDRFYPNNKFRKVLEDLKLNIIDWQEDLLVEEPLDRHGNTIRWRCQGIVLKK